MSWTLCGRRPRPLRLDCKNDMRILFDFNFVASADRIVCFEFLDLKVTKGPLYVLLLLSGFASSGLKRTRNHSQVYASVDCRDHVRLYI
jgi:hypothetical protein